MSNQHLLEAMQALERKDYKGALRAYQVAAEEGNPAALVGLAEIYLAGFGVEQDDLRAESLLLKVVSDGTVERSTAALAWNNLATLYTTGAKHVQPNPERAAECVAQVKLLKIKGIG